MNFSKYKNIIYEIVAVLNKEAKRANTSLRQGLQQQEVNAIIVTK